VATMFTNSFNHFFTWKHVILTALSRSSNIEGLIVWLRFWVNLAWHLLLICLMIM